MKAWDEFRASSQPARLRGRSPRPRTCWWRRCSSWCPSGSSSRTRFGEEDSYTFDVDRHGGRSIATARRSARPICETLRSLGLVGVITAVACVAIAFPTALALTRCGARTADPRSSAVMFPFVVSFTVRTYAWLGILRTGGPVADLTERLLGEPLVLAYRPGRDRDRDDPRLSGSCDPAALRGPRPDSGRGSRRRRRPGRPPVPAAAHCDRADGASWDHRGRSPWSAILAIGEFTVPAILGGGKTLLIGNVLAEQAGGDNQPLGAAVAVVLMLPGGADRSAGLPRAPSPWPHARWLAVTRRRIRWAPIWLGLILVFLYAPLARVVVNSLNTNEVGTSFDGFTLDWYRAAWNDETVRDSLQVSLVLAADRLGAVDRPRPGRGDRRTGERWAPPDGVAPPHGEPPAPAGGGHRCGHRRPASAARNSARLRLRW